MSSGVPTNSARRTVSFAAAEVADVDGILTSQASIAADTTYDVTDFDGAAIDAAGNTGRLLKLPRSVTITRSSAANQYSTDDIVVTGKRNGATVVESIEQPNDDGNDTLRGTQAFDLVLTVFIPENLGTGGAFQVGVQDICTPQEGDTFSAVKLDAAGTLNVQYGEASGARSDAIPCDARQLELVAPTRILTSAALSPATNVGLTVYIP